LTTLIGHGGFQYLPDAASELFEPPNISIGPYPCFCSRSHTNFSPKGNEFRDSLDEMHEIFGLGDDGVRRCDTLVGSGGVGLQERNELSPHASEKGGYCRPQ